MKEKIKIGLILFLFVGITSCSKEKRSDKAGLKMQDFVIAISNYTKKTNPNFIIIPQNGIELAFNNLNSDEGTNQSYLNAVDGFGLEELFYNGTYSVDQYRLDLLQKLKSKKILVSEFINDNNFRQDAISKNSNEGFLSFIRQPQNYDYKEIPDTIQNENAFNITSLAEAKNYLYLISTDNYSNKQAFLDAIKATNYDAIIIDLFFDDNPLLAEDIAQLKTKQNGGKRLLLSYVNIGAAEKYRYYWKKTWGQHHPGYIKKKYEGYSDEFWVKFWKKNWQSIIYGNDESYVKKILNAGFDGAYLDNVEAFYFLYYKD